MKRKYLVLGIVLLLVAVPLSFVLVGSKGSDGGDDAAMGDKPAEPVTIKVLGTDQYALQAAAELQPEFEAANNIKVEVVGPGWQAWYDKQVLEISSNSSTFDVYQYDALTAGVFLAGGGLRTMDDFLANPDLPNLDLASYVPGLVEFFGTNDDGTVGVPFYHSNRVYAYRKDLFEDPKEMADFKAEYGYDLSPPATWDQFADIAEFFTRDTDGDGNIDFWGTTAAYTFGIAWDNFADRVESNYPFKDGDWWFDKNWNPIFTHPSAVKALEDMVEIDQSGWVAPGALKKSWGDVNDEFRAGNAAMTDMFTEALTILELPDQSAVAGKTGYYVIPKYQQFHTRLSAWMIGINSKSKHAEEAYKYIAWLTSPEIDKRLVTDTKTAARMPCRIGTHYDPEVVEIMPVLKASADSFNIAIAWPLYPEFMEMYDYLSTAIQDAMTGTKSPEQALNDTADQMSEVMERAGKLK
jgi:multiple sugar transport system substrate-binding protein